MGTHSHKREAPRSVTIGILTVSTSRSLTTDESGRWLADQAARAGHRVVCRRIVPDDAERIADALSAVIGDHDPRVLVVTGGTGIAAADVTIEAVRPLLLKELTAFATLFAYLSHAEIGSAALLSRAMAGLIDRTVVFCLPGSQNACRLAWNALICPELGHLVHHL
jgi:molybdenum cofactor biosynthesis protein B